MKFVDFGTRAFIALFVASFLVDAMAGTAVAQRAPARRAAPPREVVPVPLQPLQIRCATMLPAARVRGRAVQLRLQYCGYVSTMPDGRVGQAYFGIASDDGRMPDPWPGPTLRQGVERIVAGYVQHYGADLRPLHSACLSDAPAPPRLVLCAQASLGAGDAASAIRFATAARQAGPGAAEAAIVLACALVEQGGGADNWAMRRAAFRSVLRRTPSPGTNGLLGADNDLSD